MRKGTKGYETLSVMARWSQTFFPWSLQESRKAFSKALEATDPVERERWMSRHRTLEEVSHYIELAHKYMRARHPELRMKSPNELIPPELRKGPRLVVDNDKKKPGGNRAS